MATELALTAAGERILTDLEYKFDSDDLELQDFILYGILKKIYSKGEVSEEFSQITSQLKKAGLVAEIDEDAEFELIDEFGPIGRFKT